MSYERIRATAEAARYIAQREAEERMKERQRTSAAGRRMMKCGLTCAEWLEQYHARKNYPGATPRINTEATNDDQDRREATGTEARPGGDGQGVGDAPQERAPSETSSASVGQSAGPQASSEASEWASYLDEAGGQADQRDTFDTPF